MREWYSFLQFADGGRSFSSPDTEVSQGDTGTLRYLTMLLSSRGGLGQRPWALRYHETDLISLEFIALGIASTLALPVPKFPNFPTEETAWLPGEKCFTHCRQHLGSRRNLSWQCSQCELSLPSISHRCSSVSEQPILIASSCLSPSC